MEKEKFDPRCLGDDFYFLYVHGEKPGDLRVWLLERGVSAEEADLLVAKVDEIKRERAKRLEERNYWY